jgi:hypothetical protein
VVGDKPANVEAESVEAKMGESGAEGGSSKDNDDTNEEVG